MWHQYEGMDGDKTILQSYRLKRKCSNQIISLSNLITTCTRDNQWLSSSIWTNTKITGRIPQTTPGGHWIRRISYQAMVVIIGRLWDHLDEIWGLRKALKESTYENPENHTIN